jgi:hypothetical protein
MAVIIASTQIKDFFGLKFERGRRVTKRRIGRAVSQD